MTNISGSAKDILGKKQKDKLIRLRDDFVYFAKHLLKIKNKEGVFTPFSLNKAQLYIHSKLEKQLADTGKVRALILKARQMGSSTYLEGRYYHKTSLAKGKSVFILTHEAESTKKLFDIAKRFYDNVPEVMRPELKNSNAKELIFKDLDSQYYVGTAGNANVGRGGTIQFFHGSETAFWKNTDAIMTGVIQSVPDMRGTEIVFESTANGLGNMFYERCMDAVNGVGDYQIIFIPWYWMDEYESDISARDELNDDEKKYATLYLSEYDEHSTLRKMIWRRKKTSELGSDWKFKQEYPSTIQEAFVTSGDSLVKAEDIVRARNCTLKDKNAPLVIGVDPARKGDRTVIAFRRGREIPIYYSFTDMDEMRLVGIVANFIEKHRPVAVNIDVGLGYGTVDRLIELGYKMVNGIHFASKAYEPDIYCNKRAEMACTLAEWLAMENVNIPDDNALHADLTSVPDIKHTSDGAIRLESKERIKEKYGKSPDIFDACMLTFAVPVARQQRSKKASSTAKASRAGWKGASSESKTIAGITF